MKYVFITMDIVPMGGAQGYVYSKTKWLKEQGYDVHIFFDGEITDACKIQGLNEYLDGRCFELAFYPYNLPIKMVGEFIEYICKRICSEMGEEIIVESHSARSAFWGELVAERIEAKHLVFSLDEGFRGGELFYEDSYSFFEYKLSRGELAGINPESINRLFEGVRSIENSEKYYLKAIADNHVEEVDFQVPYEKYDCEICYFGRLEKKYVPIIFKAINQFAKKFPEKKIRLWVVADIDHACIEELKTNSENIETIHTGILYPFPRGLADLVDVAIAGSGCAAILAEAHVPTIVPDALNCGAIGIMGIDTIDGLYSEKVFQDEEEMIKSYLDYLITWGIEKRISRDSILFCGNSNAPQYYEEQLRYITDTSCCYEYYDIMSIQAKSHVKANQKFGLLIYRLLGRKIGEKIRKFVRRLI